MNQIMPQAGFTEEQKQYLHGFVCGVEARRATRPPQAAPGAIPTTPPQGPDAEHLAAQDRALARGETLAPEEIAKRELHPLDAYAALRAKAAAGAFPKGADVFRWKFHGLFHVAPAQNAFMCRLRIPNGVLSSHQVEGAARIADSLGGGYAHVTTRANLQIREIGAADGVRVIEELQDLGLPARGSGADNIRNITGSPTAGFGEGERIDTRPLCRDLHHAILNDRSLYGLPRKFNVAFDGGGPIAVLEDTNDIGFQAVEAEPDGAVEPGPWLRLLLGGVTGHGAFAHDCGVILRPEEATPAAIAIIRAYSAHGRRSDRKQARLKHLLDAWGQDAFLAEAERFFGRPFLRAGAARLRPPPAPVKGAHLGWRPQRQPGLVYAGVGLPAGAMTTEQMRAIAAVARDFGWGEIRLTVWQNLLIPGIPLARTGEAEARLAATGLTLRPGPVAAGLVACTGSTGCRYAAADTKRHALAIATHCDGRIALDRPIAIHLTGCPHSCAQHFIGDIGLLGVKIDAGEEDIEAYHVYAGGGHGSGAGLGRELFREVPADRLPALIGRLLSAYLAGRASPDEDFRAFALRHDAEALHRLVAASSEEPTE